LPVVGMDVVEVAPAYDHADITALLANRVVLEALSGIAARRKAIKGGQGVNLSQPLLKDR
jgi:agmatinase